MNIVNMPVHIFLISDNVIPESVLPHAASAMNVSESPRVPDLEVMYQVRNTVSSAIYDCVEMIGHNDPSIQAHFAPSVPEKTRVKQKYLSSLIGHNRYKVPCTV
jgi:hypothetical protein